MKGITLFLLSLVPLVMNSQVCFTDGMKWRTQIIGTQDPVAVATVETVTIEKSVDDECFKMYRYYENNVSDREFVAFVMTDKDKVYFRPCDSKSTEWYLMYDFGMEPGEGCYIYSPISFSENSNPCFTYVKCVGIDDGSEFGRWKAMSLEEYRDDSCSNKLGTGTWLTGLSSLNGILYNHCFDIDGFGATLLLDVSDNEKKIYPNISTGVVQATETLVPHFNIKIDGTDIKISTDHETIGSLYDQSGVLIGDYRFSKTPTSIALPSKGIYILKSGNITKKILVLQ